MSEHPRLDEAEATGVDLVGAAISAIPILGGPIAGLLTTLSNHHERRVLRVLEKTVEGYGVSIAALQAAVADEHVEDVVEHALRVSAGARTEEKVELLASIVVDAALHPGDLSRGERNHLLLNMVERLEPIHIDILRLIGPPHEDEPLMGKNMFTGLTPRAIAFIRPDLADVAAPGVAVLTSLGLVERLNGTMLDGQQMQLLMATEAGVWLLETLQSRTLTRPKQTN